DKREYFVRRSEIGAVFREVVGVYHAAMTAVEVRALIEDRAKVEIEVTAVIPEGRRRHRRDCDRAPIPGRSRVRLQPDRDPSRDTMTHSKETAMADTAQHVQLGTVEGVDGISVIRGGGITRGWNGIKYRAGLSEKNVNAKQLSMNVATI